MATFTETTGAKIEPADFGLTGYPSYDIQGVYVECPFSLCDWNARAICTSVREVLGVAERHLREVHATDGDRRAELVTNSDWER